MPVVNKRSHKPTPDDVYIGRPSKWGNPFVIGKDGNRADVISKYRNWLLSQPHLMSDVKSLKGKTLVCWCKPAACHGDVLAEFACQEASSIHCGSCKGTGIEHQWSDGKLVKTNPPVPCRQCR